MAQLLIVLLLIAVAVGAYRCGNDPTDGSTNSDIEMLPGSRLEEQLSQPRRVEEAVNEQMDKINQRNQEILKQY